MRSVTLYRVLAVLLVLIAGALAVTHLGHISSAGLVGATRIAAGVGAGLLIGIVAALMGVAGGELIIPTIVLLFGLDIKIAGSLSVAVSLPTMLVAFGRYSQDASFVVLRDNRRLVFAMAGGSIAGTVAGGFPLDVVPTAVLVPALCVVLIISAIKVWRH
jgi:uncharacterized protein